MKLHNPGVFTPLALHILCCFSSPQFVSRMSRPWHQTFPNNMPNFPDTLGSTPRQHPVSTVNGWYGDEVIVNMGSDSRKGSVVGLPERYSPVHGTRYSQKLPRWPLTLPDSPALTDASSAVFRWVCRQSMMARFMGPTWGPSWADRAQVGPMLAPWTLLSGMMPFQIAKTLGSISII